MRALTRRRPGRLAAREWLDGYLFAAPFIIGFGLFVAYPMGYSVWLVTQDWDLIGQPSFVGGANLVEVAQDETDRLVLFNTAFFTFLAVPLQLIVAFLLALALNRALPGRDLFFALLVATMMLPEVVTLVPKFILFRTLGWIDTLLPLTAPFWFGGTPFFVFLLRQFFRTLPYELDEAARMDGAGSFRILTQIMIPLAKPALATVVVFSAIANYNDFIHPLIYLNKNEWWTLSIGLRSFNETYAARWELVMASATAMLVPMVALFLAAQRYFVQGIHLTGLAGR